jgi:phosphatidylinositol alpha-1,6-mannosyltransferase
MLQREPGPTLKVLMLATDAHGGFGGIAQYNRDIVEAMCGMKFVGAVDVLLRTKPVEPVTSLCKVNYDLAGASGRLAFVKRAAVHAFAREKLDLVYCAHINLLPVAAAIASIRRVPLVLAIYGIDVWRKPPGRFIAASLRAVSLVVSISQITLDRFRAWSGFTDTRCKVLPNAIHLADYGMGPKNNALAQRLGVIDRPVVMTLGRMAEFERYKGFDEVIDVMPGLLKSKPDLLYIAAGDGIDRHRLEAKVAALGLREHVLFPGHVAEAEKADLYRLSDVFAMPSSGEGFGFVVLEALACGVPVVASKADGTREAVRGGQLGSLVDPRDPDDLERAILAALSLPKAIPAGLEYFSRENFERRLADVLSQVAVAV